MYFPTVKSYLIVVRTEIQLTCEFVILEGGGGGGGGIFHHHLPFSVAVYILLRHI